MNKFIKLFIVLILINVIAWICLNIYYNKLTKDSTQSANDVTFIDEGGVNQ